ncbi:MAG: fatty acid desaturase family protein [Fluviicola sp.]
MATIQFSQPKGDFMKSLHANVNSYFSMNKIDKSGNAKLYTKSVILIASYIAIYVSMLFIGLPFWAALILAGALGFLQALVGFNIMHDACHDAYSSNKNLNYLFGLSMNALGSDAFMWKQKHNIVHHTFTNIDGGDDDIAKSPFLRMAPSQPRKGFHKFQHIYVTFLYAISTLLWIVLKDWLHYFKIAKYNVEVGKMSIRDHLVFWITKSLYFAMYAFLPIYIYGVGKGILLFVMMHAILGIVMSFVFQLAHVVENVEFDHTHGEHTEINTEWAVHQINTTSDFATDNKVVSWFLGGLNYQTIHHLFPRVSHIHYPEIQKIVKKTCEDYGVNYRYYQTMGKALASHFRHMKNLGAN